MDLVLNNLQRLICHKTQQTKPNQNKTIFMVVTYTVHRNPQGGKSGVTISVQTLQIISSK